MNYLGIDLGGTHIAVGIVRDDYTIMAKATAPTNLPRQPEDLAGQIHEMCVRLCRENGMEVTQFPYVGIGVPGNVNMEEGTIEYANNFHFEDTPFIRMLQDLFPIPVCGGNDADAAAMAEYLAGAGRGADSMYMVTLGTGVGGSLILHGQLWSGINDAAGEVGHMVIDMHGRQCNCGRRGCFEMYGTAAALVRDALSLLDQYPDSVLTRQHARGVEVNGKLIFDAAAAGDPLGVKLVSDYTDYLAVGITNLINIFQTEVLVIGGGISGAGDALLIPVREKVAPHIYSRYSKKNTRIVLAKVRNDAGVIGAALLHA